MRKRSSNLRFCYTVILSLFVSKGFAAPFFQDSNRGWFFYESKPIESAEMINLSTNPTKVQTPGEKAESELNQLKQELSQASALALLYPTPDNVWQYQQLKTKVYSLSGALTDQQMRNEWTKPDSYSANNPTGGEGLDMQRSSQNHCSEDLIRKSSNTYGMYLFVSKDCKYCNAQIKVMQEVQRRFDITTLIVGLNGYKPNDIGSLLYAPDNGISQRFAIEHNGKPSTIMLNVKTSQFQQLGYGYITVDNLNMRICRLFTKQIGEY